MPDVANLGLSQSLGFLLLIAAVDTGAAIVLAIIRGKFDPGYLMAYLRDHVLARVFPIFGLAVIGHGVPAFDIPAIDPAKVAALASLAAYVVETLASLRDNFQTTTPPAPGP